ncbi:N-acetylmuramoyl-L-alanine amidase [Clostridium paraputrificum]|uniref:N-acetylmuramoyl-L-alanine amidase n=1 Tax=Clostridium TaxID=1485 RepID=UPI0029014EF5|nr:N-acetylmuramoyl-L-alanine amidase [Clostridium sp.]MDU2285096.1 N-acetylmuramoyl-L-alanine amidase [Clostridium sp.]
MKKIIADFDFGHGGTDPGACSYGAKEAEQVLSLKPYLDKSAARYPLLELRYTRTTDEFISLADRVKHANKIPADILVSIHMNSFGNSSANGVETWIDYGSTKSPEVANKIHENLVKVFPVNRGVKVCASNCRFYVLRYSNMAACLIELGFISNENDLGIFNNNKQAIADSIIDGIASHYGLIAEETSHKEEKPQIKEEGKLLKECKRHVLIYNEKGTYVFLAQSAMKALGLYNGPIDGSYGPAKGNGSFYQAVVNLNAKLGYKNDSRLGPACWEYILTK